jgi:MFS superfamily sulfate permease-like transporter
MVTLVPGALGVALVAFAESIAIARSLGNRFGYEVNADQELLAVGVANVGSGFSGGFTVDGSMSRTSAATEANVNSQMASLISAVAILITAVALTPLFYHLPEATLGAIVIHAVWHNINLRKVTQYWRITRLDFFTALVAFLGVLLLGMLAGLLLAAALGLVVLLFGTKQRTTAVLGKVPGTTIYRNLENYPDGKTFPGLLILRFDGTLFFANTPDFVAAAREAIRATAPAPRVILIDGESMNGIDATAAVTLKEFQSEAARAGQEIWLARMKTDVLQVMERADLMDSIPEEHIFFNVQDGVDAYLARYGESQGDR